MGDHTAFFYGTLMAPAVLYRVIYGSPNPEPWQKDLTTVRSAILPSYRRHRVKDADYPAILPVQDSETASVRGSLVTGLTDGDIWRLDIFEGSQYKWKKVRVRVLSSAVALDQLASEADLESQIIGEEEAETYVWSDPPSDLEKQEWDFEEFKRDKMGAWIGVEERDGVEEDEGFADVDRAVKERETERAEMNGRVHDPTGGRGRGGKITEQLKGAAT